MQHYFPEVDFSLLQRKPGICAPSVARPKEPYPPFLVTILLDREEDAVPEHTLEKPFCWNSTCLCHEDDVLIAEVARFVRDGLLTEQEATDFIAGRGI